MTTKLIIQNDSTSNGDVVITWDTVCYVNDPNRPGAGTSTLTLYPGDKPVELGITDSTHLAITETWPTKKPMPGDTAEFCKHGIGVAYRCQDCGDVRPDQRQGVHIAQYDEAVGAFIEPKNIPVPEGSEH